MGSKRKTVRIRHQHDQPRIAGLREQMLQGGVDSLEVEKVFKDLGQLADFEFLVRLSVRGFKQGIETLGQLPNLQQLALWEIRDLATEWMRGMSQLAEFTCYGVKFKQFAFPARPNQLGVLSLTNCNGFGGVLDLSSLDKLTALNVDSCGHISRLSDCSHLTELRSVTLSNLRDLDSLEAVSHAPRLKSITVQKTPNLKVSDLSWMLDHPTLEEVYPALSTVRGDPILSEVQALLAPRYGNELF